MDTHIKTFSVLHDLKRRSGVIKKLAKETVQNPGHGIRKITAGVVKDPITGTSVLATQLAPIPGVGTATMGASPLLSAGSKRILSKGTTQKKLRETSKNIMSDTGKTAASRFGRKLEYHTNKALLGLSKAAQNIPL